MKVQFTKKASKEAWQELKNFHLLRLSENEDNDLHDVVVEISSGLEMSLPDINDEDDKSKVERWAAGMRGSRREVRAMQAYIAKLVRKALRGVKFADFEGRAK